jgi:hypothetical protein
MTRKIAQRRVRGLMCRYGSALDYRAHHSAEHETSRGSHPRMALGRKVLLVDNTTNPGSATQRPGAEVKATGQEMSLPV